MDGKRQKFQLRRQRHNRQRILAFCLIFSLVLSNLNFGSMLTYATEGNISGTGSLYHMQQKENGEPLKLAVM